MISIYGKDMYYESGCIYSTNFEKIKPQPFFFLKNLLSALLVKPQQSHTLIIETDLVAISPNFLCEYCRL